MTLKETITVAQGHFSVRADFLSDVLSNLDEPGMRAALLADGVSPDDSLFADADLVYTRLNSPESKTRNWLIQYNGDTPLRREMIAEYLKGLQPGERVVETAQCAMTGREGDVYIPDSGPAAGSVCVKWDAAPGESGRMGTAATWGTRRVSEMV